MASSKRAASPLDDALLAAVEAHRLEEVQDLLARGADPDAKRGELRALDLVHHRRADIAYALVEAGARAKGKGLVWAVHSRRAAVVEALLAQGADPNLPTPMGTPVQNAAELGELGMLRRLLAAGADPDLGSGITTPLLAAIEKGQPVAALALLEAGADPTRAPNHGEKRPLVEAAGAGQLEVVRALLARRVDPGLAAPWSPVVDRAAFVERALARGDDDLDARLAALSPVTTPALVAAARVGHADVVRALLAAGADPDARDGAGRTAFDRAREGGHEGALAALAERGVQRTDRSATERLLLAAERGDAGEAGAALAQGASPDARDGRDATRGFTALILAARGGHVDVVRALLAAGADPALSDAAPGADLAWARRLFGMGGMSAVDGARERLARGPLLHAAAAGHVEVVQALLEGGAPIDAPDAADHTALHLAAEHGHGEVVALLVERGADVATKGPGRATAQRLATEAGHGEVARLLLERAGARAPRGKAKRPTFKDLQAAASIADPALVRDLLAAGADPTKAPKRGTPPLVSAAGASREAPIPGLPGGKTLEPCPEPQVLEVVRLLLDAGADVDAPGTMGTPLMEAARQGHAAVIEVLLAAGADPCRRHEGQDALSIARLYKRSAAAAALEAATGKTRRAPDKKKRAPGEGKALRGTRRGR